MQAPVKSADGVLEALSAFASRTRFEDLPEAVVHETRRMLLDCVGVAFAAQSVAKGRICTQLSQQLGGEGEASILGARGKVSACNAALANGELINALDFDALFIPGGHVAPYVVPAILAIAEARDVSGRDLILALAIGTEIAMRVTRGMSPMVQTTRNADGTQSYRWTEPYGGSRYNLGAAAGVACLLGLDAVTTQHALGLSGHHTQVPTHAKLSYTLPLPMSKYGTPGWQSTGAIVSALLAQTGYEGDTTLFDGPSGFWRFIGSETWMPDKVLQGLGNEWALLELQYKPYPSCRVVHTCLDLFIAMKAEHGWKAQDIDSVRIFASPYSEKPHLQNKDVRSAMDAQFSAAYATAMAALDVPVGVEWQEPQALQSGEVRSFMQKVSCEVHPEYTRRLLPHKLMILGRIEVTARGATHVAEAPYARGTPRPGYEASDEDLRRKFTHNVSRILTAGQSLRAADSLMSLDREAKVSGMVRHITPA
ncbi:MAG TPA: MmgE/PrpD family protein [Ramlibacter sp.]|nr:MmgE/PrpD family protein [Ramlibacter sp.]